MTWDDLRVWGLYAVFAIQLVVQFIGWLMRRSLATPEQLGALRAEIARTNSDLEEKIRAERGRIHDARSEHQLLAQAVKVMPDHEDIDKLREAIAKLDVSTGRLAERVGGLERSNDTIGSAVERIEQHLLDNRSRV